MYTIYADDNLIYNPQLADEGYAVLSPKVTVELNKAGSAEFTLPPNNLMYEGIQKLKSVVRVLDGSEELFRGRVLHDEKDFYNRKAVYCEGELAFLLDSVQRPYSFHGQPYLLFSQMLNSHNAQVDAWKQFRMGQVTVTDPNNYIYRENNSYSNTLDEMLAKLPGTLGGYFRPRLSAGARILDYVAEYGTISSQVIEFGNNMLDITEYISAGDVFTVLIPLGAETTDASGNVTGRVTIESVNGGNDYIESASAINLFGRIVKVLTWDDVTLPANLLTKARAALDAGVQMAVTLSIKAVDLHFINVNTRRIKLGDYVRVVSPPHGLDTYFLCSKITYDLVNPENTEFTLGAAFSSMTDKQVAIQKRSNDAYTIAENANQNAAAASAAVVDVAGNYVSKAEFLQFENTVNTKLTAVYHVKGSVANYEALPATGNTVGDVWNLLSTGANYVWTSSGWDKLSETVDLSSYATRAEIPQTLPCPAALVFTGAVSASYDGSGRVTVNIPQGGGSGGGTLMATADATGNVTLALSGGGTLTAANDGTGNITLSV